MVVNFRITVLIPLITINITLKSLVNILSQNNNMGTWLLYQFLYERVVNFVRAVVYIAFVQTLISFGNRKAIGIPHVRTALWVPPIRNRFVEQDKTDIKFYFWTSCLYIMYFVINIYDFLSSELLLSFKYAIIIFLKIHRIFVVFALYKKVMTKSCLSIHGSILKRSLTSIKKICLCVSPHFT